MLRSACWQLARAKSQLDSHLDRATANLQLCADNCSAQVTLRLLQHTASAYQHIVTVLPPEETLDFAEDIDAITTTTFNRCVIGIQHHQIDHQTLAAIEIRTRMRIRDGGFGILSLKGRAPFAVVSAAIKIRNDADDGDPKSKRALDAIESAPAMLESIQQWASDVLSRLGDQHNLETLSKMSMAEMQPMHQQRAGGARDHLEGEMLQAWAAAQCAGANGAIAIAPN